MKIITLNAWGGRLLEPLQEFMERQKNDTDIFCLQEVFNGNDRYPLRRFHSDVDCVTDLYTLLEYALPDHSGYFAEATRYPFENMRIAYGNAIFVRKSINVLSGGIHEIFLPGEEVVLRSGEVLKTGTSLLNRLLQYVSVEAGSAAVTLFNLHGAWTGGGKEDNDARLRQSQQIMRFMAAHEGEKILTGDFNLSPETVSLSLLEKGMRNLGREQSIKSTRSSYYKKDNKFADYTLVTPGVQVESFRVLQDEVSDHLPLELIIK